MSNLIYLTMTAVNSILFMITVSYIEYSSLHDIIYALHLYYDLYFVLQNRRKYCLLVSSFVPIKL